MKTDLFQSCGHCWVFQIWWHIECSTLTASSFRIFRQLTWKSITSTSFVVILPKYTPACLTLGKWLHHCDYLVIKTFFLYSSSVYSFHLFLISFASDRSLLFLFFILSILAWNIPLISPIFLKRSLAFPLLLFSSIFFFFFCIFHLRRPFCLSLLFSGTQCSVGYIFHFLLAFHFSSFLSCLKSFIRQWLCHLAFLFLGDGVDHHLLYKVTNLCP